MIVGRVALHAIAVVMLSTAMSGCVSPVDTQSEPVGRPPMSFNAALYRPVVINATEAGTGLWHELKIDDCPFPQWTPPPIQLIRVWDQHGLRWQEVVTVDTSRPVQWYWVPLPGDGPWVVAGNTYRCYYPQETKLHNITDGFPIVREAWTDHYVELEIPVLGLAAETTWSLPDEAWHGLGASPEIESSPPRFRGTVRLHYPDGSLWREDEYDILGGHTANFSAFMAYPGEHRIVAESKAPVTHPVSIYYELSYRQYESWICEYGFKWSIC